MNKFKKAYEALVSLNNLPIYIAGHLKPDQDSVGSCLALAEFLKTKGKEVYVLIEEKDKDVLSWKGDYSLVAFGKKHEKYKNNKFNNKNFMDNI